MVPVRQCAYKQVPYTVSRPVRQTHMQECRYTVQVPVKRTELRSTTYTVCKPVRETHLQECRYTVCKPVHTTTYKTVAKTCYQTVNETAYRESCETVCVPKTVTKPVTRTYNEAVVERVYVPGKTVCVNGCLVQCPGSWCEKTVCCPRTVTENVCCTVYESQVIRKQVPITVCKKVPYTVCEQVPRHHSPVSCPAGMRQAKPGRTTCRMVSETFASSKFPLPFAEYVDGTKRQQVPVTTYKCHSGNVRYRWSPTPFCTTQARTVMRSDTVITITKMCPKTDYRQVPYTVTTYVPEQHTKQVPYTVTRTLHPRRSTQCPARSPEMVPQTCSGRVLPITTLPYGQRNLLQASAGDHLPHGMSAGLATGKQVPVTTCRTVSRNRASRQAGLPDDLRNGDRTLRQDR